MTKELPMPWWLIALDTLLDIAELTAGKPLAWTFDALLGK